MQKKTRRITGVGLQVLAFGVAIAVQQLGMTASLLLGGSVSTLGVVILCWPYLLRLRLRSPIFLLGRELEGPDKRESSSSTPPQTAAPVRIEVALNTDLGDYAYLVTGQSRGGSEMGVVTLFSAFFSRIEVINDDESPTKIRRLWPVVWDTRVGRALPEENVRQEELEATGRAQPKARDLPGRECAWLQLKWEAVYAGAIRAGGHHRLYLCLDCTGFGLVYREIPAELLAAEPTAVAKSGEGAAAESPAADLQSLDRLREAYRPSYRAFKYAEEYFSTDVLGARGEEHGFVARLVEEYPLRDLRLAIERLGSVMPRRGAPAPSSDEFSEILGRFAAAIKEYYWCLHVLLGAAGVFMGSIEVLLCQEGYRRLYERHHRFQTEIERIRDREDIGVIAEGVPRFDRTLPPPLEHSAPSSLT
jgi:hypothetical protein